MSDFESEVRESAVKGSVKIPRWIFATVLGVLLPAYVAVRIQEYRSGIEDSTKINELFKIVLKIEERQTEAIKQQQDNMREFYQSNEHIDERIDEVEDDIEDIEK